MYKVNYIRLIEILTLAILFSVPNWSSVTARAAERSPKDVEAAVETWVRHVTADAHQDAIIDSLEPYPSEGPAQAYIAHLAGGGFCLCGANDVVLPVYFYSPAGVFDPKNPDLQYILEEIRDRSQVVEQALACKSPQISAFAEILAARAALWNDLSLRVIPARKRARTSGDAPSSMVLYLTTHWNQDRPYNRYCPIGYQGRITVTGCDAVATAQIMRYWSWPPSGVSNHAYSWDGDNSCGGTSQGGQLSADFSDGYDWSSMPDYLGAGTPIGHQEVVANLIYEIGVALETDYGACHSASTPENVPGILRSFFLYDSDVRYVSRNVDEITSEIQWLRPVQFRGENQAGTGHSWVVYGYDMGTDPDRQFLMNLGHGGSDDGWYSCDTVELNYTLHQAQVTRISPKGTVGFVDQGNGGGDGSPSNPYKGVAAAAQAAPDGATLIFKAGSDNTFSSETLVISRPMALKGKNAIIRRLQ